MSAEKGGSEGEPREDLRGGAPLEAPYHLLAEFVFARGESFVLLLGRRLDPFGKRG